MSIFDGLGSFVGGLFGNPSNAQGTPAAPADPVTDAINNPYKNLPISAKLQLLGASLQDLNHPGALEQQQQAVLAQRQASVKMAMLQSYLNPAPAQADASSAVAALGGGQAPGGMAPQAGGGMSGGMAPQAGGMAPQAGGMAPGALAAAPRLQAQAQAQAPAPAVPTVGLANPYPMSLAAAQRRDTVGGFLGLQVHDVENYLKANHFSNVNGRMVNDVDPRISVNQMPADGNGMSYVADASQPNGYRAVPVSGYMTTPDKDTGVGFEYGPNGATAIPARGFNAAEAQNLATQAQVKAQTDLQYAGPMAQAKAYGEGLARAQVTPATGVTDPTTGAPVQGASVAEQLGLPTGGPIGGGVQPAAGAPRVGPPVSTSSAPRIGQAAPTQAAPGVSRLGVSPGTTANIAATSAADAAALKQLRAARDRASVNMPMLAEMQGLDKSNDLGQGPLNNYAVMAGAALNGVGAHNTGAAAAQRYNANSTSLFKNGVWGTDGSVDGGADSGGATSGMTNVRNPKEFALMMSAKPDVNMTKSARQALVQNAIDREQLATRLANGAEYWTANHGSLSAPAGAGANKGLNFYQIRAAQEQAASDRMLARWKQVNGQ